ncbi:hypothetical protein [Pseudomonas vanderleydeniana]|uniref:Uncharacterized protein n=1 Tax=Pseudomonas vanderleydeniana TaxID=2745495 RepID=A0A9E6PH06_9PSED|nr:hypothetical protein [Pseudomonas vanderleydeniana]QXI26406.1 hypothetical protein HU752_020995 [Pseudomonas vanderleydeniana]
MANLASKTDITRGQITPNEDIAQLLAAVASLEAKLERLCETLTWHCFIIIAAWTVCLIAGIKYMLNT